MKASEILSRAVTLLNDSGHVRWPLIELADWLNEGVRAIVLAKPSACSVNTTLQMGIGTGQTIPQTALPGGMTPLLLVSINRNVSDAGPGRVITIVDRALLDEEEPYWHDKSRVPQRREIRHYIYDEAAPLSFSVYPGNDGTGFADATLSALPPKVVGASPGNVLANYAAIEVGLPEPYSVPLLDYVLYRAFLKDDLGGQGTKGAAHFQQFAAAIGLKIQVEGATSPNTRRMG